MTGTARSIVTRDGLSQPAIAWTGEAYDLPFTINRGGNQTRGLNVSTTATGGASTAVGTGMPLPVKERATTARFHVLQGGGGRVSWTLGGGSAIPVVPAAYDATNGTSGGQPGERTIDPGGVEIFGLTPEQQALAAAGALFLRAICAAGAAVIEITLGNGD